MLGRLIKEFDRINLFQKRELIREFLVQEVFLPQFIIELILLCSVYSKKIELKIY